MISCSCSANPISKSLQGVVGRESEERASTLKSWDSWRAWLYNPCHVQLLIFCVFVLPVLGTNSALRMLGKYSPLRTAQH